MARILQIYSVTKKKGECLKVKNYWEWKAAFDLNINESALIVIDMQNSLLDEGSALEVPMAREQIPVFQRLIAFCRVQNIPVIYTAFYYDEKVTYTFYQNIAEQRGIRVKEPHFELQDGSYETEISSALKPLPEEKVIKKIGYDCFAETDLEEYLCQLGVSNLIVTGTVLNWCVDSTVRTAYHKHYNVTVLSDAVSSYDHAGATAEQWCKMELNLIAEAFGRVMSSDEFMNEANRQLSTSIDLK